MVWLCGQVTKEVVEYQNVSDEELNKLLKWKSYMQKV